VQFCILSEGKIMFKKFNASAAKLSIVGLLAAIGSAVHAEVPANVTSALNSLGTDALTVAGIVLTAVVGVFALKFIRKGL